MTAYVTALAIGSIIDINRVSLLDASTYSCDTSDLVCVAAAPRSAMSNLCKAILEESCMRSENSHGEAPPISSETLVDRCNNILGFAPTMKVVKKKNCHYDDSMQLYPTMAMSSLSPPYVPVHTPYIVSETVTVMKKGRCKLRFLEATLGSFTTTTTATLGIPPTSSEEFTLPFLSLPRTDSFRALPSVKWADLSTSWSRWGWSDRV